MRASSSRRLSSSEARNIHSNAVEASAGVEAGTQVARKALAEREAEYNAAVGVAEAEVAEKVLAENDVDEVAGRLSTKPASKSTSA